MVEDLLYTSVCGGPDRWVNVNTGASPKSKAFLMSATPTTIIFTWG